MNVLSTPRPPIRPKPPAGNDSAAPTLITSAQRTMRLLEAAARYPRGATAKQLARDTGLALGTTYHLLRTLVHDRYLERHDGHYLTGPAVAGLVGLTREESPTAGRGRLDRMLALLAGELSAAVYFTWYRQGEVELVGAVAAPGAPLIDRRRFRTAAHAHAAGKTLLALMSADERRSHLARYPMVALTPYTLREPEHLPLLPRRPAPHRADPITQFQEYALGTAGAAVPVVAGDGIGAVALSLPMAQAHRLAGTAARLRDRLGEDFVRIAFGM
ncbi:helix-turn-helix domain-containing protein [Kitasatospora sp. NPDC004240]